MHKANNENDALIKKPSKKSKFQELKEMDCMDLTEFIFHLLEVVTIRIALPITELIFLILYFDDYGPCPSDYQWILLSKLIWAVLLNISIFTFTLSERPRFQFLSVPAILCLVVSLLGIIAWIIYVTVKYFQNDWEHTSCKDGRFRHLWLFVEIEIGVGWVIGLYILGKCWKMCKSII
eukprot:344921_1